MAFVKQPTPFSDWKPGIKCVYHTPDPVQPAIKNPRDVALERIEHQLAYGYIDLGLLRHDEDELDIIEEALKLWKSVNGIT